MEKEGQKQKQKNKQKIKNYLLKILGAVLSFFVFVFYVGSVAE